jgi:hypothetical protein
MMVVAAPVFSPSESFFPALDSLLFQICEELQITPTRHDLVVKRYETLNRLLESNESPFRYFGPEIYPQGSMALGTTVKPIDGPHDLDFVLELSNYVRGPMRLISELYEFLRSHDTYAPMTTLKNRCVRIEYADEFYMDVLPAVRDARAVGTCIKVPDCALAGWTDSNPRGYIKWFKEQSGKLLVRRMFDKAEPIPDQQAVAEKDALQLVVQLLKRWRDLHYAWAPEQAPISIVLTTLAADTYRGDRSVSGALTSALTEIVALTEASRRAGETHLHLCNPSNMAEDLTERWDSNPAAYAAFERGIRNFHHRWTQLIAKGGNVNSELESLFGEPVKAAVKKRAQRLQESRSLGKIGVSSAGIISGKGPSILPARPNTFYGEH